MCEEGDKLIFCSCLEDNKKGSPVGQAQWGLSRYQGSRDSGRKGKIMKTSEDLGKEINRERIIAEMNARNCFDFDYIPQERDSLKVNNGLKGENFKYFSLIFLNGQWQAGSNLGFGHTIMETLGEGKVRRMP